MNSIPFMTRLALGIGFFLALFGAPILAQPGHLVFNRFGIEQGFSNESVQCLLRDQEGFLWVGTENGLNCYDGARVRVYHHRNGDPTALPANWIQSLTEDRNGSIWIGTAGGLSRYDRKTDTFQTFLTGHESRAGINPVISRIFEDRNGLVWLCTTFDLIRFDPKVGEMHHFPIPSNDLVHNVFVVTEDSGGTLWVGTSEGLWTFNRNTGTFSSVEQLAWKGLSQFGITDLALAPDGRLFATTWTGLRIYDIQSRRLLATYRKSPGGLVSEHFHCLALMSPDTVALGTNEAGLEQLNLRTGAVTHYPLNVNSEASPPGNSIRSILYDRTGILWIGDASYGLGKASPFSSRFRLYRANPLDPNSLSDNYLRGIWLDSENLLWVGTQTAGLNRLNRQTDQATHFRADPGNPRALPSDNVRIILEDRAKVLWIGTENGLCRFDRASQTFTTIRGIGADHGVNALYEDRAGNLWLNSDEGVIRLGPDRKTSTSFKEEIGRGGAGFAEVQCFFEDRLGNIWIGHDHGVTRFKPGQPGFRRFESEHFGIDNPIAWYVTQVSEDREGTLWVVTKGGGIHKLDRETDTFTHFKKANGLPHDNAYGMFEDEAGRFWISTDNGLAAFHPKTGKVELYGLSDGLQGMEFNRLSFHRGHNGEFFFGGTKGLNSFFPNEIRRNPTPPRTLILEVNSEDRNYRVSSASGQLLFPPTTRRVTILFAALDLHAPEKNQYQYQLAGFDRDWTTPGTKAEAVFTNLPPGDYVFQVRATNNDGIGNDKPVEIRFRIQPPWWRTWWAVVLFVMVFALIVYSAFRLQSVRLQGRSRLLEARLRAETAEIQAGALERENRQRAEAEAEIRAKNLALEEANQKLKELDELKRRFTAMLVHDLKSPLAVARGALELAEFSGEVTDGNVLSMLTRGQHSLDRVVAMVNQVLEVFKTETDSIVLNLTPVRPSVLLQGCLEEARIVGRSKNIEIRGEIEENLPLIQIDQEKMLRVFTNLVSNALKFTSAGGIVTLSAKCRAKDEKSGKETLLITVSDTGEGIPAEDLPYIFNPYHQAGSSQKDKGVGLGLAIVKRIVVAHGGTVQVQSEVGVGSMFTVALPISVVRETAGVP